MKSENKIRLLLRSIPWKFFKRIALSQIVLMSVVILIMAISSRYYLKLYITNQSKNQLIESLQLMKHSLKTQNIDPLSWCNSLEKSWTSRYSLIDSKGVVLCDSFLEKDLLDNHLYRPEIQMALSNEIGTSSRFSSSANIEMIYGAVAFGNDNQLIIRQALPLEEINVAMRDLDNSVLLFFAFLLFITVIISLATSLKVAFPLKSLLEKISEFDNLKLTSKHFENDLTLDDEWIFVEQTLDQAEDELAKFIKELQVQNKKFSILMDSISDSILAIDKEENILFMNKKYFKTFNQGKIQDFKNLKLLEVTRSIEVQNIFKDVFETKKFKKIRSVELSMSKNTNSVKGWFDLTASPLLTEDGESLGAVCSFNNVSDKILAEQMREDFVTNVSHEVRTPLTAIQGYTQILSNQVSNTQDPVIEEAMSKIEHNSNRLGVLFQEILNLSLIESINKVKKEEISTEEITLQVISNLNQVHLNNNKDINSEFKQTTVWADPNLLEQVLINLVDNSIKYSDDNAKIDITWDSDESFVTLVVQDDGPGISEQHLKRIFERFYRVDSSRSRELGGTGLGLSIVKHIVQKHNGTISATGNSLGGTSFIINLPKI